MYSKFFDYIFYRVAKVYYRWDKYDHSTAIVAVAGIQYLIILNILAVIYTIILPVEERQEYSEEGKFITILLALLFVGYNYYRYNKVIEFTELDDLFNNEPKKMKILKGVGIILLSLFLLSFMGLYLTFIYSGGSVSH